MYRPFNRINGKRFGFDEPSEKKGVIASVKLAVHDVTEVHIRPEYDIVFPVNRQA